MIPKIHGMVVKIKRLRDDIPLPAYKTAGAAGCDVTARSNACVRAKSYTQVFTGLFLEVPVGYECQIRPRSGVAANHGVTVLNSPGTLDSDYRGELIVLLYNTSENDFYVEAGDRIAQLVFAPVVQAHFEEIQELSSTERGAGGFGSTGK